MCTVSHVAIEILIFHGTITDQLNTCIQETVKCTPCELVYGQPPRSGVFPGNTPGHFMEEDVMDLINENNPSNKCKLAISMCINYLQVLTMQIVQLHAMNHLVFLVLTPRAAHLLVYILVVHHVVDPLATHL